MKPLCDCDPGAAAPAMPRRGPGARRKLWQLARLHQCLLLGAAFDPRELRRMFRRAGSETCDQATDYELHSSAIHYMEDANELSRHAQRAIEQRYRAGVHAFSVVSGPRELLALWRAWAAKGEAMEAYWAALTHPDCDVLTEKALYEEMHMVAHDLFAARRSAARRIRELGEALRAAQAERDATRERSLALRREAARLREEAAAAAREAADARAETARASEELERWRSGERGAALQARLDAALKDAGDLRRELDRGRRRLERLAASTAPSGPASANVVAPAAPQAEASPRRIDFGRSRVLCVGGKRNLIAHYRDAVEGARGQFLYHDGGVEDGLSRLPALLGSADAVVCLSGDCSHGAVHAVKRYCKRFGKPCALLANSSVSALAQCIEKGLGRAA